MSTKHNFRSCKEFVHTYRPSWENPSLNIIKAITLVCFCPWNVGISNTAMDCIRFKWNEDFRSLNQRSVEFHYFNLDDYLMLRSLLKDFNTWIQRFRFEWSTFLLLLFKLVRLNLPCNSSYKVHLHSVIVATNIRLPSSLSTFPVRRNRAYSRETY